MALKIRLRQQGRNNRATFRLVVTDCRAPRDGKYVEMLGWYSPFESKPELTLSIKEDRIQHWLDQGAQMSDSAKSLIKQLAPSIVSAHTQKEVAQRAKMATKRKVRNKQAA